MQKPSLAIDFDGVIAETLSRKSAWIRRYIGLEITPADCCKSRCEPRIGAEAYSRMSRVVGYADTLECPPFEGAQEGIRELAERFSINVFTARPEEKTHWAREWFRHQRLTECIDSVISTYGSSKAALAVASGSLALVDNDIRHLREETPTTTQRVLFCPSGDGDKEVEGIMTVSNWRELVDALMLCCL